LERQVKKTASASLILLSADNGVFQVDLKALITLVKINLFIVVLYILFITELLARPEEAG